MLYTTKFLNSLKFPGTPNYELQLKVELSVMLLRNINHSQGLCNGIRLIVTHLGKWSIMVLIMLGKNEGNRSTFPRIVMSLNESKWSFRLRRQIPLTPCFTMTTNKSQGQSLNHVGLFTHVIMHGQLYVVASRVTSRRGLIILNADDEVNDP